MIKIYKKFGFVVLIFLSFNLCKAQVGIEKAHVDGSGILDFPSGTTRGIILPIVTAMPTGSGATNGTILMDYSDKKVKMRSNNQWIELSRGTGDVSTVEINPSVDNGAGIIIGQETSSADGVLVLEATDKALILPKIASPQVNVKTPYPGMICYDTTSKSMAVYNGTEWFFWK